MVVANACCTPVSPPIPHIPLSPFSPCLCLLQNSSVESVSYESHMATSPGEEYPSATKPVYLVPLTLLSLSFPIGQLTSL